MVKIDESTNSKLPKKKKQRINTRKRRNTRKRKNYNTANSTSPPKKKQRIQEIPSDPSLSDIYEEEEEEQEIEEGQDNNKRLKKQKKKKKKIETIKVYFKVNNKEIQKKFVFVTIENYQIRVDNLMQSLLNDKDDISKIAFSWSDGKWHTISAKESFMFSTQCKHLWCVFYDDNHKKNGCIDELLQFERNISLFESSGI